MFNETDNVELVRKAQQGDRASLDRLAETARVRLHEYVFRMTLDEDLTGDIVQETILEMLRIFKTLQYREKFWGWLHGIAFNKVRRHYGKQWRQQRLRRREAERESPIPIANDVLTEVVTDELKQIILTSVQQLAPRHRAVLTLRCYDHLSYAEISRLIGCTEIGARAVFYRAKRCLAGLLSEHGLGKGSLLLALVAFGKMTAASTASAAQVAITGATLQVGPLAAVLAMLTGKTGLIALAAAGTVAAASVAISPQTLRAVLPGDARRTDSLPASPWQAASTQLQECWYYFPEGGQTPVMIRLLEPDAGKPAAACRILQNQYANYHYDDDAETIRIKNYHAWKPDLSVTGLPTDDPALSRFVAQVQGHAADMELTRNRAAGLLVICRHESERAGQIWRIDRHMNVLDEEYFHFSWPETAPVVDDRDAMHRRGWTFFQIDGSIGGRDVSGTGRVPFVYTSARKHYPWLRIEIDGRQTCVDTPQGAGRYDRTGRATELLPGGSFFQGLPRPWTGLHCVDTIRRDAAQQRLRFETVRQDDGAHVKVIVHAMPIGLVYTVDMQTDIVETIELFEATPVEANRIGRLSFAYLQEIAEPADRSFDAPREPRSGPAVSDGTGLLWLTQLAGGR
ncbi:MAG: RNA polymerase sigma factor [Phycisphaerae bacterium]|nr:RNA polymerase sigma factor [Phycisphaerae bacterium]